MSLPRVKTWSDGETLTHTDLNAEFDSILNNATTLVSPFTATVDFDGNKITLDSDGDLHLDASTDDRLDVLQGSNPVFRILSSATSEDGIQIVPIASAASTLATIEAIGNSSVIGINFVTKGSGPVQVNGSTITTGGLGNVNEDTTPQLGGTLDTDGNDIDLGGNSRIDLDADNDTSLRARIDDRVTLEIGGTDSYEFKDTGTTSKLTFDHANSADREVTFPNATFTVVGEDVTQSLSNKTLAGVSVTGSIDGDMDFSGSPTILGNTIQTAGGRDANMLYNLGVESSVTSSAITFTLLGADGNTLSASNAMRIAFRDATASTAFNDVLSITSDVQLTVPDGATLGASNSSPIRAYLYAANDSGTLMPCIARQALFDEGSLQSVTAIASTADSASVLYGASNASDVPIRLIGQVEMTSGAVAGSWESTASVITVWHPGMRKTGDVVQVVFTEDKDDHTTTATTIPQDDTIPQSSEGDALFSLNAITPTNALNRLTLTGQINHTNATTGQNNYFALFANNDTDAVATSYLRIAGANIGEQQAATYSQIAGQTTAFTFKYRWGVDGSTGYVNLIGANDFGDTLNSTFIVKEIYS